MNGRHAAQTEADAMSVGSLSSGGAPRVLLVDDDAPLLAMLGELLPEYGIRIVGSATDGAEVIDALHDGIAKHGAVDVVVMDERMPRMSGLAATREVVAKFPDVAVILHTAYAGLLGDQPRAAGVVAEISKGSHPTVLVEAIHTACRRLRAHATNGRP